MKILVLKMFGTKLILMIKILKGMLVGEIEKILLAIGTVILESFLEVLKQSMRGTNHNLSPGQKVITNLRRVYA